MRAKGPQRWATAKVFALLVGSELAVRFVPLPIACRWFGVRLGEGAGGTVPVAPISPVLAARLQEVALEVDRVFRIARPHSACLRRSLVIGALLRDLDPVLCIGVARRLGVFRAHAWLEVVGQSLSDASNSTGAAFSVLRKQI